MKWIMTSSVYDLSPKEKVKILSLLCDQLLMLSTTREFMEDAYDHVKELQKELKQIRTDENKRRNKLQNDRWKEKVAERKKLKEEAKLKKEKEKLAQQQKQNDIRKYIENSSTSNPGTPTTEGVPGTPMNEGGAENKENEQEDAEDREVNAEEEREKEV